MSIYVCICPGMYFECVLMHTITSQNTHHITKLLRTPSWLNMFEHEGLFFHSFYWLALFPLFLSLFSYLEAHDGVSFWRSQLKEHTRKQ